MVLPHGLTLWSYLIVSPHGLIAWSHFMVSLYGPTLLAHLMVSSYGLTLRSHPMVSLFDLNLSTHPKTSMAPLPIPSFYSSLHSTILTLRTPALTLTSLPYTIQWQQLAIHSAMRVARDRGYTGAQCGFDLSLLARPMSLSPISVRVRVRVRVRVSPLGLPPECQPPPEVPLQLPCQS